MSKFGLSEAEEEDRIAAMGEVTLIEIFGHYIINVPTEAKVCVPLRIKSIKEKGGYFEIIFTNDYRKIYTTITELVSQIKR